MLFLLLNSSLTRASDLVDLNFVDFVRFVSNTSHSNIVIDENIDSRFSIILPSDYKSKDSLELLANVLDKNGMSLQLSGSTYYIRKYVKDKRFYSISLFFELPETMIKAINGTYPDLNVSSIQKTIAFKTDPKTYGEIKSLVEMLDRPKPQRKLKVMMISYNDSDLREYGAKLSASGTSGNSSYNLSSVINTLLLGNTLSVVSSSSNISLSFSALASAGLAEMHLDNVVSLFDGKSSIVRATKTIPYLSQSNDVNGNQSIINNSYDYKDVGTEIELSNVTVTDEDLYFQALFRYQQLVNDSSTPTTSKREVINYLRIPKGNSILISGIHSRDESSTKGKIPILGDIPLIGSIFSYDQKTVKNETFAIYLENVDFIESEKK